MPSPFTTTLLASAAIIVACGLWYVALPLVVLALLVEGLIFYAAGT